MELRRAFRLTNLRRLSQAAFGLFFLYLFFQTDFPALPSGVSEEIYRVTAPVAFFFHLDPLVALTAMAAGRIFLAGVLLGGPGRAGGPAAEPGFLRLGLPLRHPAPALLGGEAIGPPGRPDPALAVERLAQRQVRDPALRGRRRAPVGQLRRLAGSVLLPHAFPGRGGPPRAGDGAGRPRCGCWTARAWAACPISSWAPCAAA